LTDGCLLVENPTMLNFGTAGKERCGKVS